MKEGGRVVKTEYKKSWRKNRQGRQVRKREESGSQNLQDIFSKKAYASSIVKALKGLVGSAQMNFLLTIEEILANGGASPEYWGSLIKRAEELFPPEISKCFRSIPGGIAMEKDEEISSKISIIHFEIGESKSSQLLTLVSTSPCQQEEEETLFRILKEFEIRFEEAEVEKCICICGAPWNSHLSGKVEIGRDQDGEIRFFCPDTGKDVFCPKIGEKTFPFTLSMPEKDSWLKEFLSSQLSQAAAFVPFSTLLGSLHNLALSLPRLF